MLYVRLRQGVRSPIFRPILAASGRSATVNAPIGKELDTGARTIATVHRATPEFAKGASDGLSPG